MRQQEMHTLTQGIVSSHGVRSRTLASLREQVVTQRGEAQSHLRDLYKGRQAVAREQRAALSKGRAELLKVRPRLRSAKRQHRSAIQGWLRVVAKDRVAAHREWHDTISALRGGGVGAITANKLPATPTREVAEEEAVAEVEVGEVTEELARLGDRVFAYLAGHPDGVRLVEMEGVFGLGRFESSRVVRSLIEAGKVERRDRLYFAV